MKMISSRKWDDMQVQVCRVNCDKEYIRKSLRALGERFKHLKAPSLYMTIVALQVIQQSSNTICSHLKWGSI